MRCRILFAGVAAAACLVFFWAGYAWAQSPPNQGLVVRDGSLGDAPAGVVLPGTDALGQHADYLITPDLGEQRGGSLFHSFEQFSIGTGETATFTGPDPITGPESVQNIISRVTGGAVSEIDGTLRSAVPDAAIYLLNPSGLMFGPGAQLDIQGAFHASTAADLQFPNGQNFEAHAGGAVPLLAVSAPEAFGFLGDANALIEITGSLENDAPIDLRAGAVELSGRGLVQVGAGSDITIEASESVVLDDTNGLSFVNPVVSASTASDVDAGSIVIRAPLIELTGAGGSQIRSETTGGMGKAGSITLEGDRLLLDGLVSSTTSGQATGDAGSIALLAPDVTIRGLVSTSSSSAGNAGSIALNVPRLRLESDGAVQTVATGAGAAGDITIEASESVVLDDTNGLSFVNPVISASTSSDVDAGSIVIRAPYIELTGSGGSQIRSETTGGMGKAGSITLEGDRLLLDGLVSSTTSGQATGDAGSIELLAPDVTIRGLVSTSSSSAGNAGSIALNVPRLRLESDGAVQTVATGAGAAGDITIEASESVVLDDTNGLSFVNPVISASTSSDVDAGSIVIRAPYIELTGSGGSQIRSETTGGMGKAGSITLEGDRLLLDGLISSATSGQATGDAGSIALLAPDVTIRGLVSTSSSSAGNAGSIALNVPRLRLESDGAVRTVATGAGAAGDITIEASESVVLDDTNGLSFVNPVISASTSSDVDAGSIVIRAPYIELTGSGGSQIRSETTGGMGKAGSITLEGDRLLLDGVVSSATSGQATGDAGSIELLAPDVTIRGTVSTSSFSAGNAGAISMRAPQLHVSGAGRVLTEALGGGSAGKITIEAAERILLDDAPSSPGGLEISARTSSVAEGGSIVLRAPSIEMRGANRLTSETTGPGKAGSITLEGRSIEILGGQVSADALAGSSGSGGKISLLAGESLLVGGTASRVTARTAGSGTGGAIEVDAADLRIENGGEISTRSTASGDAGAIVVGPRGGKNPTQQILLSKGSISTSADDSGGGNISIRARKLVHLKTSEITASVARGEGGSISIDPVLVLLEDSRIVANASETGGRGGRVEITADLFFALGDSLVDASAPGGPAFSGSVEINSPEVDVAGSLATLPESALDASSLLGEVCAARGADRGGRFAVLGRDGAPAGPDGPLWASMHGWMPDGERESQPSALP